MAKPKRIPGLLALLAKPGAPDDRSAVESALREACRAAGDHVSGAAPLAEALPGSDPETATVLIRLIGGSCPATVLSRP